MNAIVREPYARNLFKIMKAFHLTPASPDFYNMTSEQLEFMLYSIQRDEKELYMAQNGIKEEGFAEDEEFNWTDDLELDKATDNEKVMEEISRITGTTSKEQEDAFAKALESARIKAQSMPEEEQSFGTEKSNISYVPDDEDIDTI